jgi:hypothetical protein
MQMEVERVGVLSVEAQADVEVLARFTVEVQGDAGVVSILKCEVPSGVEPVDVAAILTVEARSLNDFQRRKGISSFGGS